MYTIALLLAELQRPSSGSPFTDASLPFEQLKAPPDTAFDILMASLAMLLLSMIVVGVFIGVSKLGSIEELLRKEAERRKREPGEGQGRD